MGASNSANGSQFCHCLNSDGKSWRRAGELACQPIAPCLPRVCPPRPGSVSHLARQMPRHARDRKVDAAVPARTERRREVVHKVIVADVAVACLALATKKSCHQLPVICSAGRAGGRTDRNCPPERMAVILFAMEGFSATQRTFIVAAR